MSTIPKGTDFKDIAIKIHFFIHNVLECHLYNYFCSASIVKKGVSYVTGKNLYAVCNCWTSTTLNSEVLSSRNDKLTHSELRDSSDTIRCRSQRCTLLWYKLINLTNSYLFTDKPLKQSSIDIKIKMQVLSSNRMLLSPSSQDC